MPDALVYYELDRNGTVNDGEHRDVFDVVYRSSADACNAGMAVLRSLDPAVLLGHPYHPAVLLGHPYHPIAHEDAHCNCWQLISGARLTEPCNAGIAIEYRHVVGSATYDADGDGYPGRWAIKAHGLCEWRSVRRWTERRALVVDGVEFAGGVPREETLTDWATERPRPGGPVRAAKYLHVQEVRKRWAEASHGS